MKKLQTLAIIYILLFVSASFAQKVRNQPKPIVPVVLLHGIGGSNLRQPPNSKGLREDGGFPNDVLKTKIGKPQNLQLTSRGEPRDDTLSKTIVADGFYDVPGKNITDLSKNLIKEKGYERGKTLFEFAYDFRFSVFYNAGKLEKFVEKIKSEMGAAQVDIVGHSMGGLIAKAYLLNEENHENVRTLIFAGTPHLGAPKALKALRYGDNLDVFLIDSCKVKRAVRNFPSMYNLLPGRRYFEAAKSGYFYENTTTTTTLDFAQMLENLKKEVSTKCSYQKDDVHPKDTATADDVLNQMMIDRETVEFHDTLNAWKKPANVKVYNIVGYGVSTIETIRENADGKIIFGETTEGDGTVPLWSAEAAEADATYFINLDEFNTEHSAMIGKKSIFVQISSLLENGANIYIAQTSNTRPTSLRFSKRTRGIKIK